MMRLLAALFLFAFISPAHAAKVSEVVSDKGMKAWLVEEHSLPLVAVKIAFAKSGTAYDPAGKEGRANMAAALLMEGAGDLDFKAFGEALESHAIELRMGADEDLLNVSLESLSEHTDKAFYYLGLALTRPRFEESSIARVQGQTVSLLTQLGGQPGYLMSRAFAELAFGTHPYSKPQLGTKETVAGLNKNDFIQYTQQHLSRENMVIAIVGDITPAQVKQLLDTHLAALPERYSGAGEIPEAVIAGEGETKTLTFDIPQTMVTFGTQGLKRNDPLYFDGYVMNQILGGGGSLNSKLGREIREKRGLAYSVFSGMNPLEHAALWQGGFSTRNEQVHSAVDTLKSTLKDFITNGPSDAEFNDAKQYLKGSFVLNLDSNSDIAAFLINMQINKLGIDYLDKRNALVDAVTKQGVVDMARRLADPDKLRMVMVGKPAQEKAP